MRRLFCLIGIAAAVLAGCKDNDTPTTPTPTSAISLTGNMNFGSVTVGQSATSTLTIGNTGSGALTITSVTYPTGFTGSFASGTVPANGSQAVTVTFTPTAAQTYSGNIIVTGNQASGTNTIAVSGSGTAIPTFTLSGIVTETPPTTSTVLSGVVVTFIDGANQGKTGTTGADGRYQITGVVNGGFSVSATKAGYTSVTLPVGVNGNTTLDFRLEPTTPRTQFGPGQYRIGTDMPAGRYYSDTRRDCHFTRVRGFGGTPAEVIADVVVNFDAGQWIVDLLSTDLGFVTDVNCGTWFTTPRTGLSTTITPGMWIVGAQITPGTYQAPNAGAGCFWQRVSNFTGGSDAVIANQFSASPGAQLVTIASTDAGFSTNTECGTWNRTP
ncbi:MAG TPA: choice-of-anchor D domain-containing protein [Vicinamibacterales bacterium]|nr:choice-of-anchor D domain-containing protein [Vicinamibacterales bacterium]